MGKHTLIREYLIPNRNVGCICYCDKLKKEVSASIEENNTAKCSWCGDEFKVYVTGYSKIDGTEPGDEPSHEHKYIIESFNEDGETVKCECGDTQAREHSWDDGLYNSKTGIVHHECENDGCEQTLEHDGKALLKSLSVKDSELQPKFSDHILEYTIKVPSTKNVLVTSEVTATPVDENAKVTKDVVKTLSSTKENIYNVTVTAEDGITKNTYKINVKKEISDDATLSDVTLNVGVLKEKFDKNKKEYTILIPEGVDEFQILASASVSGTQITGNGKYKVSDGPIIISTQAQSGKTDSYTFNVVNALSDDATLANLSIKNYPLDRSFQSTEANYNIGNIAADIDTLTVIAAPTKSYDGVNSSKLEYFVNDVKQSGMVVNVPSEEGIFHIKIKVTALDGVATQEYIIEGNKLSGNTDGIENVL